MDRARAAWRWWCASPARDAVFAVTMTIVMLAGSYGEAHPGNPADKIANGHPLPHTPTVAFLLVIVAGLVLAGRRRYPLTVLAISTAAVMTYSLLGYVNGASLLLPTAALYAVAQTGSVRRAFAAAAVTLVALMAATAAANPFGTFGGGFDLIPGLIAAALFAGLAVNNRRKYIASIQGRAEDEARRRVDEERLRIARELHDVVAHTMATINVQAGVAAHVLAEQPDAAAAALRAIKAASKDGLRELRAVLNVLRQADEAETTRPAPGLAQLDALVAGTNQAGLPTTVTVTGDSRPLPAEVDLAAYRIVQESLTNAIRHAGPASAMVCLTYDGDELAIDVADTGRGALAGLSEGTGHGLIGMRERAASVGGTVRAGPGRPGGYLVSARLPIEGRLPADVRQSAGPAAPARPSVPPDRPEPETAEQQAGQNRPEPESAQDQAAPEAAPHGVAQDLAAPEPARLEEGTRS
ncbi:MAG TPA: histidine kinase [Streptosporangiaceae bacterium]|nr:histidine kinase [Streptosporangiaceae bacterium]